MAKAFFYTRLTLKHVGMGSKQG